MNKTDIQHVASIARGRVNAILAHWVPGGKREGSEYVVRNPARADNKLGSFSINIRTGAWSDFATDDKGGDLVGLVAYLDDVPQGKAASTLVNFLGIDLGKENTHCPTTGSQSNAAKVQSKDDFGQCVMPVPDDAPNPPDRHHKHGVPTHRYAYLSAVGVVNFYHDRYELGDGKKKQFSPLTLWQKDGAFKWRFKAPQGLRPLYGLPSLTQHPDAPVWLVEGEKSADALSQLCPLHPILTWQGGSSSVVKAEYTALGKRDCVIFRDNDDPGLKAQQSLIKKLQVVGAASIKVLAVDQLGLKPGWEGEGDTCKATLSVGDTFVSGGDAADLVASGWQAEHFTLFLERDGVLLDVDLEETKPETPTDNKGSGKQEARVTQRRSELRDDGVYALEQGKDSNWQERWISVPLEVPALARDANNGGWASFVRFSDRDGVVKRLIIPSVAFNGDGMEVSRLLLNEGLRFSPSARKLVVDYVNTQDPVGRVRTTSRTGWQGSGDKLTFVLHAESIGGSGEEWLFGDSRPEADLFKKQGTLAQWRDNVAALCVGNSRLVFPMSVAFAAPLLHIVGMESGGFHLRGTTSSGKTSALLVAGSVCGSPDYLQRWRATDNGLEAVALSHCDAILTLDELKMLEPRIAGEASYMLANGSGKVRSNQKGGARDVATWRILYLSTGELSLNQHVAEVGKQTPAGAELRMADIPADAGKGLGCFEELHGYKDGSEFAKALSAAVRNYYGTAFPAFINHVIKNQEYVRDRVSSARDAFEKQTLESGASGQVQRVAARFALVGAAGELATEWGITGWQEGEAWGATTACFNAWVNATGGQGDREEHKMITQVQYFLEKDSQGRFADIDRSVVDDNHAAAKPNMAGYREHIKVGEGATETHHYIYTQVFQREVCKGFDWKQVARALINRGLMKSGDGKHYKPKVTLPGEGSKRVFHVLPAIGDYDND